MPILRPNTIFADRYLLIEHLGSGGFSEVWKVQDQMANDATLVVKVFSPHARLDKSNIDLFKSEFSLLIPLKHPHLLKANQFDTYEGRPYLLLDYCRGGNLYTQSKNQSRSFTEWELAEIISQIGGSLGFLHEKGIVHQDIKPDNILIGDPGNYYLTDFGISIRVRQTLRATMGASKANARNSSTFTPEYASPELFRFARPSYESDVFSFGVMLYELAVGNPPCERTGEALMKIEDLEIPQLPAPYSKALSYLLTRCMSRDPQDRPTAKELHEYAQNYLVNKKWPIGVMGKLSGDEKRNTIAAFNSIDLKVVKDGKEETPKVDNRYTQKIASENTKKNMKKSWMDGASFTPANRTPAPMEIPIRPRKPPAMIGYQESPIRQWKYLKIAGIVLGVIALAALGFKFAGSAISSFSSSSEPITQEVVKLPFIYEGGQTEYGVPKGHGVAEYGNSSVYNGNWRNGKKHGLGDLKFPNGDSYFGEFENDQMHGENGTYSFVDVDGNIKYKYIGNFKNGKIEGTGKLYGNNGKLLFRGRWENGNYVGRAD